MEEKVNNIENRVEELEFIVRELRLMIERIEDNARKTDKEIQRDIDIAVNEVKDVIKNTKFVGVDKKHILSNFEIVGFGEFEDGSILGKNGEIIKSDDKRWNRFKINNMKTDFVPQKPITAKECAKLAENTVRKWEACELYNRIEQKASNGYHSLLLPKAKLSKEARKELEGKGFTVCRAFDTNELYESVIIRW